MEAEKEIAGTTDRQVLTAVDTSKKEPQLKEAQTKEGWDLGWLILVSILALIPRLLFLFKSDFGIESDEAIVGLMAMHIIENEARPIFYYGQHYLGALEAYLVAGSFSLWGISKETLKLVPTACAIVFVILTYIFARQYTTKFGARVASLLIAIAPQSLMIWSTKARGGFIELLLIGTLACILTISTWRNVTSVKIFTLGFILGLGWWVNNQIIFYAISSIVLLGFVIYWRENFWAVLGAFLFGLSSFLLGGAAFWYANLFQEPQFRSFEMLFGKSIKQVGQEKDLWMGLVGFYETTAEQVEGFFSTALPIIVGSRRFWSEKDLFPFATDFAFWLFIVAFVFLLYSWMRGRKLGFLNGPLSFLVIFFFSVCLIFSASSFGWLSQAPRYLLPLYSIIYVAVGIASVAVRTLFGKKLSYFFVSCFLLLNITSNYLSKPISSLKDARFSLPLPGEPFVFKGKRVARDHSELIAWLQSNNVSHVFTDYWIGYRLAFETKEAVTFSRFGGPRSLRIPEYEYLGTEEKENKTFVLVSSQANELRESFLERGTEFSEQLVGEYVVFTKRARNTKRGEAYQPKDFTISSSHGEEFLGALSDNNLGTRWRSAATQVTGMTIELEFKEPQQTISGIDMDFGFWPHDAAQVLIIYAQNKDGSWCKLFKSRKLEERMLKIYFEPTTVNKLKFVQAGEKSKFDWSIAELKIFKDN